MAVKVTGFGDVAQFLWHGLVDSWVAPRPLICGSQTRNIASRSAISMSFVPLISTFEVLKMASESHFFVHKGSQNAFYKPERGAFSVSSGRSKALESMVLDT